MARVLVVADSPVIAPLVLRSLLLVGFEVAMAAIQPSRCRARSPRERGWTCRGTAGYARTPGPRTRPTRTSPTEPTTECGSQPISCAAG